MLSQGLWRPEIDRYCLSKWDIKVWSNGNKLNELSPIQYLFRSVSFCYPPSLSILRYFLLHFFFLLKKTKRQKLLILCSSWSSLIIRPFFSLGCLPATSSASFLLSWLLLFSFFLTCLFSSQIFLSFLCLSHQLSLLLISLYFYASLVSSHLLLSCYALFFFIPLIFSSVVFAHQLSLRFTSLDFFSLLFTGLVVLSCSVLSGLFLFSLLSSSIVLSSIFFSSLRFHCLFSSLFVIFPCVFSYIISKLAREKWNTKHACKLISCIS